MTSYQRTALGVLLIVLITLNAAFIVSKLTDRVGRIDLTQENLYTLSPGSRAILDRLQVPGNQPFQLKLFYSKELVTGAGSDFFRDFNNYYYYVRDLLRSYEKASGGKLEFVEYDPRPFSDAEEEADRLRIRRFNYSEDEAFYFGLAVTSASGSSQVIEFLSPFSPADRARMRASFPPIEYEVSELIELASRRQKTKLGVLSSLDVSGGGTSDMMRQMMRMQGRPVSEPWAIVTQLGKHYEVADVAADAGEIDAEIDFLMVVHPKGLEDKTLYAIDQFVMRGGRLIVFTDPFCYIGDQPPPSGPNQFGPPPHDASSDLNRLLEKWGVKVSTSRFAGDLEFAKRVGADRRGSAIRFVGSLAIDSRGFGQDSVITRDLKRAIEVLFAGYIEKVDVEGVTVTPLITTTGDGNSFEAAQHEIRGFQGQPDITGIASKFRPGSAPLTLAAHVAGKLKSAFPDGKPKDAANGDGDDGTDPEANPDEPKPAAAEHLAETREDASIVVVADVDMLTDPLAFVPMFGMVGVANSNLELLLNSLEFLSGSADLINIRSKARIERPFTVVDEIERDADLRTQAKVAEINADIQRFEAELSELRSQATEKNVGLLQNEAIEKQRAVEAKIRDRQRELNAVQKSKREDIESLGRSLRAVNMIGVPALILVAGIGLFVTRRRRRNLAKGGAA